ncbi:IS3 family element, transposase orfB [Klebsiella variicola]|nr:IS3 family element, transposase orfB [Klebsiella variicola]
MCWQKELTLAHLREWGRDQQARYGASERKVCFALRVSRNSFRYRSVAAGDSALRLRIREITETRVHYGYRRVHVMLRREGWRDNHKRIYRLYSEQELSLRLNRPRGINRHCADSPSLRDCIRIMSGAWTLSLTPYLTRVGYVC